jgi:hypothetical protein
VSTKFSVWVKLLVKINVLSDCCIPESMFDISAFAECSLYMTVLWKIFLISEEVTEYTLCNQNVAFAVCITVMYWGDVRNQLPRGGNCQTVH